MKTTAAALDAVTAAFLSALTTLEVLVEAQGEQGDEDDALPGTEVAAVDRASRPAAR